MCGIAGVMGSGIQGPDLEVLRDLSKVLVVRGQDGAGILQGASYTGGNLFTTIEKTGQEMAYLMWYHAKSKNGDRTLFRNITDNFFCIHVRAATKGSINDANAHPFEFDNIIGMHNGTLKDNKYLYDPTITDTEMMFADMDRRGVEDVLRDLDKGSAYAIVVLDKKRNEFIFARNAMRPFFITYNQKRNVIYYASEIGMLKWILDRNGIDYGKIFTTIPGRVYRFHIRDIVKDHLPKWRITILHPEEELAKEKKKEEKKWPSLQMFQKPEEVKQNNILEYKPQEKTPDPLPEIRKATEKIGEEGKKSSPTGPKLHSKTKVMERSLLHTSCIKCFKDMDLLAQYQGYEVKSGMYLCKDCDQDDPKGLGQSLTH